MYRCRRGTGGAKFNYAFWPLVDSPFGGSKLRESTILALAYAWVSRQSGVQAASFAGVSTNTA